MDKQRPNDVVSGANMTLCFPVLWRGVGACETKDNAVGGKVVAEGRGEELSTVITLDTPDEYTKLGKNKFEETEEGVTCVGFGT